MLAAAKQFQRNFEAVYHPERQHGKTRDEAVGQAKEAAEQLFWRQYPAATRAPTAQPQLQQGGEALT